MTVRMVFSPANRCCLHSQSVSRGLTSLALREGDVGVVFGWVGMSRATRYIGAGVETGVIGGAAPL